MGAAVAVVPTCSGDFTGASTRTVPALSKGKVTGTVVPTVSGGGAAPVFKVAASTPPTAGVLKDSDSAGAIANPETPLGVTALPPTVALVSVSEASPRLVIEAMRYPVVPVDGTTRIARTANKPASALATY